MLAKASFSPQKINAGNKGVLSDSGIKGLWRVLGWSLKGYWPEELPQQVAWFIHKYNTLSNQQGVLLLSALHPVFPHNDSLLLDFPAWEYVYYANRNMQTSAAKNQCNNVLLVYNKLQIHINTSSPIWTSRDQTPVCICTKHIYWGPNTAIPALWVCILQSGSLLASPSICSWIDPSGWSMWGEEKSAIYPLSSSKTTVSVSIVSKVMWTEVS